MATRNRGPVNPTLSIHEARNFVRAYLSKPENTFYLGHFDDAEGEDGYTAAMNQIVKAMIGAWADGWIHGRKS